MPTSGIILFRLIVLLALNLSPATRLLFADLILFLAARGCKAGLSGKPLNDFTACQETVNRLAPIAHAFNFNAAGTVCNMNTGGVFVDMLTTCAGGADETLLKVFFADAELGHRHAKQTVLLRTDGKSQHLTT